MGVSEVALSSSKNTIRKPVSTLCPFIMRGLLLHIHILNPFVMRKKLQEINTWFGLKITSYDTNMIHRAISEGVYLKIQDIINRLHIISKHRVKALKRIQARNCGF